MPTQVSTVSSLLENRFFIPTSTFNPSDGTWLWITDYGAIEGGVADCSSAIRATVDASRSGYKKVYIPPGVWRASGANGAFYMPSADTSYNGITIRGAGVDVSFIRNYDRTGVYQIYNARLSNMTYSDMTFDVNYTTYTNPIGSNGIAPFGCTNCSYKRLKFVDCDRGLKTGSYTYQATGLVFEDITMTGVGVEGLHLRDIDNSTFTNTNITNRNPSEGGTGECAYIESDCYYLTFTNSHFIGGESNVLQFNNYNTNPAEVSHHINMTDTIIDISGSDTYAMAIGTTSTLDGNLMYTDINMYNTTIIGNHYGGNSQLIRWAGGTRIKMYGVQAYHGNCLNYGWADTALVDCLMDGTNGGTLSAPWGTYDGTLLTDGGKGPNQPITGLTLTNMVALG